MPENGQTLVLRRGRLEAPATIVWKAGRKAGIAFGSVIHVAEWISKPSSAQDRVDRVVQAIRTGSSAGVGETCRKPTLPFDSMLETELEAVKNYLAELEQGLLADVIVVATHPEIQLLDLALQSVDRLLLSLRNS